MSRRGQAPKREILPDPLYQSPLVTKYINSLMWDGKRAVAVSTFYGAMDMIKERTSDDPLKVFRKAIDNVKPALEVKSRRVGGSNYQVPIEVRPERRTALAFRWIIQYARARGDKSMANRLANELMSAAKGEGGAIKKKDDTHRMAEANKAFAHFRF